MRTPLVRRGALAAAALSLFFATKETNKRKSPARRVLGAALALSFLVVAALLAAPFLNPSFESNGGAGTSTFANWTVVDQPGSAETWFVQTGTASPGNGFPVAAPTNGSFAAMSDQDDVGSTVLYQDIAVTSAEQVVRFDLYINNHAADFANPASLDYNVGGPNQQFRADILSTAAPITDVGAGVLLNIYQTKSGDPLVSGYTQVSASLASFVGQTVRLRFASVDTGFYLNVGIDNITTGIPVPTLSLAMLGLMAAALVAAAVFLLKRA